MKKRITTRRALGFLVVVQAGLAAAGCQGHGKYTETFRQEQSRKMAAMKAMTSWDMAHQQYLAGDLKKALKTVNEALELAPQVAKSHTLRGRILIEQGALESAQAAFDTAIELDPDFVDAHYFRGIVLERFTRFEQAIEAYSIAASLDGSNPQYVVAWAEMLIQLDRLGEAWSLLEEKRADFENNAGIRQTMGHIALMQQDLISAIDHFKEASLLAPDDEGLIEDLARAYVASGEYAQADHLLRRIIDNWEPADEGSTPRRDLLHLRAQCLGAMDQLVAAREILLDLTSDDMGSTDAPAWYALGRVGLELNDRQSVRDAANKLLAISPATYHGHLLMALFQRERGDIDRALRTIDRAVSLATDDPEPALVQAVLLAEVGRHDAAQAAAAQAVEIDPDSIEARSLLAALAHGNFRLTEAPIDD